jgi:glutamate formiminotransferase
MNLTDFEQTGMLEAFSAVQSEAARYGVDIASTEIIGLVPRRALDEATARLIKCENFSVDRILEHGIETALSHLHDNYGAPVARRPESRPK